MNTESSGTLTLEKLLEAKKKIEELPDPIKDYMKEKGFDPEKTVLILPVSCEHTMDWGIYGPPSNVRFSSLVPFDSAFLVKDLIGI